MPQVNDACVPTIYYIHTYKYKMPKLVLHFTVAADDVDVLLDENVANSLYTYIRTYKVHTKKNYV